MNLAVEKKGSRNTAKRLKPIFLIYILGIREKPCFLQLYLQYTYEVCLRLFTDSSRCGYQKNFLFLNICISKFWITTTISLGLDLLEWLAWECSQPCWELSSGWGHATWGSLGSAPPEQLHWQWTSGFSTSWVSRWMLLMHSCFLCHVSLHLAACSPYLFMLASPSLALMYYQGLNATWWSKLPFLMLS